MLIPIDVSTAKEAKPVPAGVYDLQITDCQDTKSQKGLPQFKVSIAIAGHDDAPNVTHFVSIPSEGDEPDKQKAKILFLKRFLTLFKQPIPSAIDTEKMAMSLPGAKARAELQLSEPDDNGNIYNRLQVPRLKDEASTNGAYVKPPKS